ncbi:unnamed protein product [Calypogeia fissa]
MASMNLTSPSWSSSSNVCTDNVALKQQPLNLVLSKKQEPFSANLIKQGSGGIVSNKRPQKGTLRSRIHPWRARAIRAGESVEETSSYGSGIMEDILFSKLLGMENPPFFLGETKTSKVTVVGVGNVGMACVQTILTENLADVIALVDIFPDKLRGEMLDLQHAAAFLPNVTIMADTDYKVTAGSDICIITAGARQREGEDRLSLVDRNVSIFKNIIPQLVKHSPDTILLVVSNPVDVLTWASWKLSNLPPNRVIGSGTTLDSSRFRALIANVFHVSAQNVHAQILGEHGETSVPLWKSVNVAGVPIFEFLRSRAIQTNPKALQEAHKKVVDGAAEVIKLKGYTSWAIGYSVSKLVSSLLRNQRRVYPVSVLAQGFHGIEEEVYISLPASLGRAGVVAVANSMLSDDERRQLQASARGLYEVQKKLGL